MSCVISMLYRRACLVANDADVVFGPWKAEALSKDGKVAQQQLAELRAAVFAGRLPTKVVRFLVPSLSISIHLLLWVSVFDQKSLVMYVARERGSSNDKTVAIAE